MQPEGAQTARVGEHDARKQQEAMARAGHHQREEDQAPYPLHLEVRELHGEHVVLVFREEKLVELLNILVRIK